MMGLRDANERRDLVHRYRRLPEDDRVFGPAGDAAGGRWNDDALQLALTARRQVRESFRINEVPQPVVDAVDRLVERAEAYEEAWWAMLAAYVDAMEDDGA